MTEENTSTDEQAAHETTEERASVTALAERLDALEAANEELRDENEELRDRVAAFENLVGEITPLSRASGFDAAVGRDETDAGTLMFDGSNENYKILGQFEESNAGIGVLGCNTASSGATTGVKGEVDSGNDDAAGVHGVATDNSSGAGADGVVGETSGPGSTGGGVNNPNNIATGVSGLATNSSAVNSYGVYGSNVSSNNGTAGVFGFSFGGAGRTYGVRGETTSSDQDAAGVTGEATSSSGTVYGVSGTTNSDASGAAGVYGESNSGATYGVSGKTSSGNGNAAGVSGESDATDGVGVRGKATGSGATHGVEGVAGSSDGYGLYTTDGASVDTLVPERIDTEGNTFEVDTTDIGGGGGPGVQMGQESNVVLGTGSVVAGGGFDDGNTDDTNNVVADYATVSGGRNNNIDFESNYGTISGGRDHTIGDADNNNTPSYAAIGGGQNNTIPADTANHATVAGGKDNDASADKATVSGGQDNEASGSFATVAGGRDNVANSNYSFAAGRLAKAQHPGSFVFGDSTDQNDTIGGEITSSGEDQFIVQGTGGIGLGTPNPDADVHIGGRSDDDETTPGGHAAIVEDFDSLDLAGAGLAITLPFAEGAQAKYLTCFEEDNGTTRKGGIQGNSNGDGVTLYSTGSDYAEYMPRLDADEQFEPGDVVGVVGDSVTKETGETDRAMVVSEQAIVTGNDPGVTGDRDDHELVAFVGQVPVKVRGSVAGGDLLVASGREDGTATAVDPDEWEPGTGPLVGRALEGDSTDDVTTVTGMVGVDDPTLVAERLDEYRDRIAEMEAELAQKDERIDELAERLAEKDERMADLEDRLATVETQVGNPATPADD